MPQHRRRAAPLAAVAAFITAVIIVPRPAVALRGLASSADQLRSIPSAPSHSLWPHPDSCAPLAAPASGFSLFGADGLKLGRKALSDPGSQSSFPGLATGMGWSWQPDAGVRLASASAGEGSLTAADLGAAFERFRFSYGKADELQRIIQDNAGAITGITTSPEGRIGARDGVAFSYDAVGRRTEDDRFVYQWDWRGRLLAVTVKLTWPADPSDPSHTPLVSPLAGQQVRYTYDTTGRLLSRTNLGTIPQGGSEADRPFIAKRAFVWDGQCLAAETGLNFQSQPIWRQHYAPGPRGLDDAPLVRIENNLQATPSTGTYALIRDEMGTVMAVAEDKPTPGQPPTLLARYLYTPYGERHTELGPELVRIEYDVSITTVDSEPQTPTLHLTLPGALRLVTTSPLAASSLATGLTLEQWDQPSSSWQSAPRSDFAVAASEGAPADLRIMRIAGWAKATQYRITLLPSLTDGYNRPIVLPTGEVQGLVVILDVPDDGVTPPSYLRTFPLTYTQTMTDTLNGSFPGGQTSGFQGAWPDPITGLGFHRARWLDHTNATWMSEDPASSRDSVNVFAFVGGHPLGATDPNGLYEADVHTGMTYYLALQAGFDESEASDLAFWAEWPDVSPTMEPRHNAAIGNWEPIYTYHFPVDPSTGRVEPGGVVAMRSVSRAESISQFGAALHTLEDSFGHSPSYPGNVTGQATGLAKGLLLRLGELSGQVSHPEQGITHTILNPSSFWLSPIAAIHAADYTWIRPALAFSMECTVFSAMVDYLTRERGLSSSERHQRMTAFARFSPFLNGFNSAWTKQQKMQWLETHAGLRGAALVPWNDVTLPFSAPPPSDEDLRRLLFAPPSPSTLMPVSVR